MADEIDQIQDANESHNNIYDCCPVRNTHQNDMNGFSTPIWLITFTDVIALMLTFFVLLFSMSNPEVEKWEDKVGTTLQSSATYSGPKNFSGSQEGVNLNRVDYQVAENMNYLQGVFDDFLLKYNGNMKVDIQFTGDRAYIIFQLNSLDNLINNNEFLLILNQLTPLLKSLDNKMSISSYNNNKNSVLKLQNIGKILLQNGYTKDIGLQTHDDINKANELMFIIEAHNGQRITR